MPFWSHTPQSYSGFAKLLHWLTALGVLGLFGLGFWMVDLTYYDPWYQTGPAWHISLGVLLAVLVAIRLLYRWIRGVPGPISGSAKWEIALAHLVHAALYLLLWVIFLSGYFIVTAEGDSLPVFDWLELPASGWRNGPSADSAGGWHKWAAYLLMGLVVLHAIAAFKHQFWNRDGTLMRMITKSRSGV